MSRSQGIQLLEGGRQFLEGADVRGVEADGDTVIEAVVLEAVGEIE